VNRDQAAHSGSATADRIVVEGGWLVGSMPATSAAASGPSDYAHGFTPAELRRMRELAFQHAAFFLERWNEYSGG
jgi:hypothetical protein